ncbi:UDP-glucuronic acid decarboxylase 2 [Asimina triloba]
MGSELIFRGHESQPASDAYSPKPPKRWLPVSSPIRYMLREQRLLFVLLGMAIASVVFALVPSSPVRAGSTYAARRTTFEDPDLGIDGRQSLRAPYQSSALAAAVPNLVNTGGKVPLGLKRKGLRIVVTGGAGFVGSHLVDRLIARGDSVIVVDNFFTGRKENVMHHFGNPRFELIRHDVVEPLLLEVDQIYHLACPASPVHYNSREHKTNVVGTLNMLGLAKRVGARFLLTSTSEVYGDPLEHPQAETYWGNVNPIVTLHAHAHLSAAIVLTRAPDLLHVVHAAADVANSAGVAANMCGRCCNILAGAYGIIDKSHSMQITPSSLRWLTFKLSSNPLLGVRSCYDEGKRTAETLTMDYHRGASVEVRIARIFNTYGPRMCIDDGRVVSNFVAQALRKEPLTVYGDGKQTRSFQYVSDLVEGLMRLMEGEHVGPFNLGNPGEFTMLELAQVVQETIDPNARIEFRPNTEDDPHKRKPDISKAKAYLGWEPLVPLRKGLPLMVSDFRTRIFGDHKDGAGSS